MTRDEAVVRCRQFWGSAAPEAVAIFVDLGMLKVDVELSADEQAEKQLIDDLKGRLRFPFAPEYLHYALEACGLRLVKK